MLPRMHSLAVISTILCLFDNLTLNETVGTLSKSSPQSSPTMESHVILIEWQYKSLTWNTNNLEELVERRCTTAVVHKDLIESTLRPSNYRFRPAPHQQWPKNKLRIMGKKHIKNSKLHFQTQRSWSFPTVFSAQTNDSGTTGSCLVVRFGRFTRIIPYDFLLGHIKP